MFRDFFYPDANVRQANAVMEAAASRDRRLVTPRAAEGIPAGNFDLVHFRAIHWHPFRYVYDAAEELRTVEIAKGGHQSSVMDPRFQSA